MTAARASVGLRIVRLENPLLFRNLETCGSLAKIAGRKFDNAPFSNHQTLLGKRRTDRRGGAGHPLEAGAGASCGWKLGSTRRLPISTGHTVVDQQGLRHFQDCGHQVQFLIGDFTGIIRRSHGKNRPGRRSRGRDPRQRQSYGPGIKILDPEKRRSCSTRNGRTSRRRGDDPARRALHGRPLA